MSTESPLKVQKATKERVRLGAAILACTQGEVVDRAVAEYLENHKDDLRARAIQAREALLGSDDAMLAYLRGEAVPPVGDSNPLHGPGRGQNEKEPA